MRRLTGFGTRARSVLSVPGRYLVCRGRATLKEFYIRDPLPEDYIIYNGLYVVTVR